MATATSTSVWKSKQVMTAFIFGILFAIFIGHAYMVYQIRVLTLQNSADIAAIGSFLEQATGSTPVASDSVSEEVNMEETQ